MKCNMSKCELYAECVKYGTDYRPSCATNMVGTQPTDAQGERSHPADDATIPLSVIREVYAKVIGDDTVEIDYFIQACIGRARK